MVIATVAGREMDVERRRAFALRRFTRAPTAPCTLPIPHHLLQYIPAVALRRAAVRRGDIKLGGLLPVTDIIFRSSVFFRSRNHVLPPALWPRLGGATAFCACVHGGGGDAGEGILTFRLVGRSLCA